ncbi:unnamed protein product, partial [Gulo gulo]
MAPDSAPVSYRQTPEKARQRASLRPERGPDDLPPRIFLAPGSGTVLPSPSSQVLTCFLLLMAPGFLSVFLRRGCPDLSAGTYQQGAEYLHSPQACTLSVPGHLHVLLRNHLESASLV